MRISIVAMEYFAPGTLVANLPIGRIAIDKDSKIEIRHRESYEIVAAKRVKEDYWETVLAREDNPEKAEQTRREIELEFRKYSL